MPDIIHRVGIQASTAKVYTALTTDAGLASWWTTDTSGAGVVGSLIHFRFNGDGPDFEVIELLPEVLVRWHHSGDMPAAWMGTEVSFKLTHQQGQTYVLFSHAKWRESSEFMGHCSTKWAIFLMSLKDSLETGKGRPFPDDIHIDHDE